MLQFVVSKKQILQFKYCINIYFFVILRNKATEENGDRHLFFFSVLSKERNLAARIKRARIKIWKNYTSLK